MRRHYQTSDVDQFLLNCRCGAFVSGNRPSKAIAVQCRSCEEELFVLPMSPRCVPKGWVHDGEYQILNLPTDQRFALVRLRVGLMLFGLIGFSFLLFLGIYFLPSFERVQKETSLDKGMTVENFENILSGQIDFSLPQYVDQLELGLRSIRNLPPETEKLGGRLLAQARACLNLSPLSLEDIFWSYQTAQSSGAVGNGSQRGRLFFLQGRIQKRSNNEFLFPDYQLVVDGFQAVIHLNKQSRLNEIILKKNSNIVAFFARLKEFRRDLDGWIADFEDESVVVLQDRIISGLLGLPFIEINPE